MYIFNKIVQIKILISNALNLTMTNKAIVFFYKDANFYYNIVKGQILLSILLICEC